MKLQNKRGKCPGNGVLQAAHSISVVKSWDFVKDNCEVCRIGFEGMKFHRAQLRSGLLECDNRKRDVNSHLRSYMRSSNQYSQKFPP